MLLIINPVKISEKQKDRERLRHNGQVLGKNNRPSGSQGFRIIVGDGRKGAAGLELMCLS